LREGFMDTVRPPGLADAEALPERPPARRLRLVLSVTGLRGGVDALRAEAALADVPGVIHAYVNPVTEMAYIEYDAERATEHQLAAAIDSAGFRAGAAAVEGGPNG
jgi:copper chaperone CopZ